MDDAIARVKAAEIKARQVADAARKAAAQVAIFTALALVIGAFIASAAAAYGGSLRDEGPERQGVDKTPLGRVERFGSSSPPGFSAFGRGALVTEGQVLISGDEKAHPKLAYAFLMTTFLLTAASWETVLRRSLLMAQGACTLAEYWRMGEEGGRNAIVGDSPHDRPKWAAVLAPFVTRARANAKRSSGFYRSWGHAAFGCGSSMYSNFGFLIPHSTARMSSPCDRLKTASRCR